MDKAQAIHAFWSGFEWPAFDESTVPEKEPNVVSYPYITYMVSLDDFEHPVFITASLWDYGKSWERISRKATEVAEYVGLGGKVMEIDGGKVWIQRGRPFAQRIADEDDMVRRIMINIDVEFFTAN